jgi:surface protein
MKIKNLFCAIISLVLLWSCGKDDGPEPVKNNAPKIEAQSFTVTEDISDTAIIGTVKATDADQDELTFSIEDNDLFKVDVDGNLSLKSEQSLDFETKAEHIVKVSVSDGIADSEANITITVTNIIESLSEDPDSFITLWNIPEDNFEIMIGTNPDYEYNYIIDWGDGTQEQLTTQNPNHTYTSAGEYKVSIQGGFPAIKMGHNDFINDEGLEVVKSLIGLEQWGTIVWENFNKGFANCVNMEYHATDIPNLQNVGDMSGMFASFSYVELDSGEPSVFNGDLSNWDVSNVTDFSAMFLKAEAFNSDLSGWDVSNALNFSSMFHGATLFNANIGGWDVSNATNLSAMFAYASSFNIDISGWDVSNVIDMSSMFAGAENFNQDISSWDVSNATNLSAMFAYASSFNIDISGWDVSNVTDMANMFLSAINFNQDIGGWDVSNVTDMRAMFAAAESFNSYIGGWDVSNVTDMSTMFADAHTFNSDISEWDVSSVTDMSAMFAGASAFNMDIAVWNLSNVEDIYAMFAGAENFNQDISSWDVGNVKSFLVMFVDAISFNQNLGSWSLNENISTMGAMFDRSGMSAENYGATLVGWHNNINTPQNVELGAEGIEYCEDDNAVATARETLINDYGWIFDGDIGVDCN